MPNNTTLPLPPQRKTPENIFVCLGRKYHLEILQTRQPVNWTISRKARSGDAAIFYLINPISAFVGIGTVTETPRYEHDSEWREKHFSVISDVSVFGAEQFISNALMRTIFPEWRYLLQPRSSVAVPSEIIEPLWELINEKL